MTASDIDKTAGIPAAAEPIETASPETAQAAVDGDTEVTRSSMRRRAIIYAIVAVGVIGLIVAAAVLTARDDDKRPRATEKLEAASESGRPGEPAPSGSPTGAPSSRKPFGNPTSTTPAPNGAPTKGPGLRPTAPAAAGSKLTTITTPPEKTLAMLSGDAIAADARYAITFRPFGTARLSESGLVIDIETSQPLNDSAKPKSFADRTVFASYGDKSGAIKVGGVYKAELGFKKVGDNLMLVLYKIEPQQ